MSQEAEYIERIRKVLDVADENLHARYEVPKAKDAFNSLLTMRNSFAAQKVQVEETAELVKKKDIEAKDEEIQKLKRENQLLREEHQKMETLLRVMDSWSKTLLNQ